MTRKPSSLVTATQRDRATAPPPEPPPGVIRPDSRRGKKTIAFWADIAAARQLRRLAADEDRTVQDLMLEALDDLFRKKNLPRIAQDGRA
jgi:hypothetical protein